MSGEVGEADHFSCQQDKWHRVPCYTASGKLIRHAVHLSLKLTLNCEGDYPNRAELSFATSFSMVTLKSMCRRHH